MRLAVIGTGRIAWRFASDLRFAAGARIVAVGGRDRVRAERLAAAIGSDVVSTDIGDAMALDTVDAVYVATANDVHAEHALMAIAAGKPVLVEKPLATKESDARRIAQMARAAGVFAMEAMWMRFTPGIRRLKDWADADKLGSLQHLQAGLSFRNAAPTADAGSALADLGVYPISLALHLLGPATRVNATGRRSSSGILTDADLILTHDGADSSLSCSWSSEGPNRASLRGEAAYAETGGSMLCPPFLILRRTAGPEQTKDAQGVHEPFGRTRFGFVPSVRAALQPLRLRRTPTLFKGSGLQYQVEHMADCLRQGLSESPIMPLDESCRAIGLIDEALAQIR